MGKAAATAITVRAAGRKSTVTEHTGRILAHELKYAFINDKSISLDFFTCDNPLPATLSNDSKGFVGRSDIHRRWCRTNGSTC